MRNSGRREAAAQAEADRLRARIEELSADLARSEEQVTRLAIAREEVARVLEEPAADPAVGREKPNRKRMACLVTVYDAEPAPRWGLDGAEAVLTFRAVIANSAWPRLRDSPGGSSC